MKKFYCLFLSILLSSLLLLLSTIPTIALTTDSLFEDVESACDLIYDLGYTDDNENQNNSTIFPIETIVEYTAMNCETENIEAPTPDEYVIRGEALENRSSELFSNIDISKLRTSDCYDSSQHSYVFHFEYGGWGAFDDCALIGYKQNNNLYTFYGYLGSYYVDDKDVEKVKSIKNLYDTLKIDTYTEYVLIDPIRHREEKYFYISHKFKTTISYKNNTVKFHSWEIIDSLPSLNELVTYKQHLNSLQNGSSQSSTPIVSNTSSKQPISSALSTSSTASSTTQSQQIFPSQTSSSTSSSTTLKQPTISSSSTISTNSNTTHNQEVSSSQTNTSTITSNTQKHPTSSTSATVSTYSSTTQSQQISSSQTINSTISSDKEIQTNNSEQLNENINSISSENYTSIILESTIDKSNDKSNHSNTILIIISVISTLIAIGSLSAILLIRKKK